jgi:hypothetical protein
VLALGEDELERAAGHPVVRVDVEDRPVGLDGLRQVAHVVLVDLAHAVLQGDDLLLLRGDGDLPAQVLDQGAPPLEAGEDAVELGDGVAVLAVDVEDRQVAGDRVVDAVEPGLEHAREAVDHLHLGRRIEDVLGLLREQPGQLLPLAGDLGQPVELVDRRLEGRVDRQRPRVRVERVVVLAELTLVDRGDHVQALDLSDRILRVLDHHLVDVDELLPLGELVVQRREHLGGQHRLVGAVDDAVERSDRGRVVGGVREGLAVRLDGADHVSELVLPQRADAVAQLGLLLVRRGDFHGALEDAELVGPALRGPEQAVERLDGVVVGRLDVEDRLVGLDRVLDVGELLVVDLTEQVQPVHAVLRLRGELRLAAVDVAERLPRLGGDVQLVEGVEGALVGVVDREDLLEQGDRAGEVLHLDLADLGRVGQQALAVGDVGDHLRLADDGVDEGVEVVLIQVDLDQTRRRPRSWRGRCRGCARTRRPPWSRRRGSSPRSGRSSPAGG